MIKRIELINFMSHEHTVIEPADGLTVLVGPNNCGKSAVVTALQILAGNEPSTYVGRHGETHCSIRVQTDEGHKIEWSRGKNKSPKYVINGQTYDRLKGGVPEALLSTLRMPKVSRGQTKEAFDIHFGQQKSPVFLVNDPPRAAADFFAASSDAGLLLEMQVLHRQKTRDAKHNHGKLSNQLDDVDAKLQCLQLVPDLNDAFSDCQARESDLRQAELKKVGLEQTIRQLNQARHQVGWFEARSKILNEIKPQPTYDETDHLQQLIASIEIQKIQQWRRSVYFDTFAVLKDPPALADTRPLSNAIQAIGHHRAIDAKAMLALASLESVGQPPMVSDTDVLASLVEQTAARHAS